MKSCLVVDDSRVIRKVSRHILETLGFAVEEAENGQLGLEACETKMPDVVLLDWNMPVMTGIEFITQLRKREHPLQTERNDRGDSRLEVPWKCHGSVMEVSWKCHGRARRWPPGCIAVFQPLIQY